MTEKEIIFSETLSNRQKYHAIFGEWIERKKAWREIKKLQAVTTGDVAQYKNIVTMKEGINILSDESQESNKLLACSLENLKDPEYLLQAHGYDVNKFKLVSAHSSIWQQQGKENGLTELYSSKIKVAPLRADELTLSIIQEFLSGVKPINPKQLEPSPDSPKNSLMLEVVFTDLHVGLISRVEQTGQEYSNHKLDNNVDTVLTQLYPILKNLTAENLLSQVTLCFLGDLMHYDNVYKATTKGTVQESANSFQADYTCALNLLYKIYQTVAHATTCPVHTVYVPGNHDEMVGYTLMKTIEALHAMNQTRFTFDLDQKSRKIVTFGKVIIGYLHGKMDKARISKWVYNEAKEYISAAETIEIHAGHLHSESVMEDNGVKVRHIPSLTGQSTWEYNQGYHSKRTTQIFVWNETDLESIYYMQGIRR